MCYPRSAEQHEGWVHRTPDTQGSHVPYFADNDQENALILDSTTTSNVRSFHSRNKSRQPTIDSMRHQTRQRYPDYRTE